MNDYLILLVGVVFAGAGGELFVRGSVGLARWARISPAIVGATIAAFATSSPELSVAVNSSLAGKPEITLGDAFGSNVVNVALILALALLISGIQCSRGSIRRDFPAALLVPVVAGALMVDGVLSRVDGVILLVLFLTWLGAALMEALKMRTAPDEGASARQGWIAVLCSLAGLVLLVFAGNFIVTGARGIAVSLGMDAFVIGATIVAVGTSVPELATTLVSKLRGHDEVGLGTVLGSNVFNGLFIISVAAMIHPITVSWRELAVALVFGFVAPIFAYPSRAGFIGRSRGVMMLLLYALYLYLILSHRPA